MQFNGTGQINMNEDFGKSLFDIASLDNVKNIIETGTWNGQGSTICIMNAIINKEYSNLYSVEACEKFFMEAEMFWEMKNTKNKLHLLNGTLHKNIPHFEANNPMFVKEWYDGEKRTITNAKLLNIDYINDVDFIIIDGGEYTARGDYNVLIQKNPKYIAMDDINCYKCNNIRKQLLNSSDWQIYKENTNERNGWSIFVKK